MATTITLGSSPIADRSVYAVDSSPGLPSLQSLIRPKPSVVLKAGSRAAPIPEGSATGFCTASSFAKSQSSSFGFEEYGYKAPGRAAAPNQIDQNKQEQPEPVRARKGSDTTVPKVKKHASTGLRKPEPIEERRRGLDDDAVGLSTGAIEPFTRATHIVHSKKTKQRKKKAEEQSQLKNKVTKPGNSVTEGKPTFKFPPGMKFTANISQHFTSSVADELAATSKKGTSELNDLQIKPLCSLGSPLKVLPLPDLRETFAFHGSPHVQRHEPQAEVKDAPAAKRRRIAAKEKKDKSPVKKSVAKSLRTVTGVAIAQFNVQDQSEDTVSKDAVDFFAPRTSLGDDSRVTARFISDQEGTDTEIVSKKTKQKKDPKAVKSRSRKATGVPVAKLLEPDIAINQVNRQDLFFGTSSQLTKAEPLTERDGTTARKGLWSTGARGDDDYLLDAEPPPVPRSVDPLTVRSTSVDADIGPRETASPIDTGKKLRVHTTSVSPTKKSLMCFDVPRSPLHAVPVNTACFTALPIAPGPLGRSFSTTEVAAAKPKASAIKANADEKPVKRPRGRPRKDPAATTVLPEKQKTGPRKPRKKISEKDESTEGVRSDLQLQVEVPKVKKIVLDANGFEDIEDLEARPASTPQRRRHGSPPSPPSQLELSPSQSKATKIKIQAQVKQSNNQEVKAFLANEAQYLYPLITRAIKSSPRSELEPLSWHEKMLLYDPIVIEDLARWLNSGPLEKECSRQDSVADVDVIWEGEAKPWMVQKWCEEHSVCCLWKGGLRGGVKARY